MDQPCSDVPALPSTVSVVRLGTRTIYLIGTAHVSRESVEDVRQTVAAVNPDTIAVELCANRHEALTSKDSWRKMNVFRVIREHKAVFLLGQLGLTAFYRKLGSELGVEPGAEMLEGVKLANDRNIRLLLADRRVDITLKRVWHCLGFWRRMKMLAYLLGSLFTTEKIEAEAIEALKKKDQLEAMLSELADQFPEVKKRLLDERDEYLAEKLRQSPGERVVAVVGAGHVAGIIRAIEQPHDLTLLDQLPVPSRRTNLIQWAIPLSLLAVLVWAGWKGGMEHSVAMAGIWVVVTGTFAALGVLLAMGHPLAILSAFVASPITTLHPLLASGWFAGLAQAWIRPPSVADCENLPVSIMTFKGFWTNPLTRVLLVVTFSNLGSSLGVFVSGALIASKVFGNG